MSGIAGIWGRADQAGVAAMLDVQKHRGPDGRAIWTSPCGRCTLGHDRLASVDLEGDAQPLANEDGTLRLVLHGEIYNYEELRRDLEGRHRFQTRRSSEVVLHLYEEEGPACLQRLDGVFALALWNAEGELLLARDPLGIKPLYYGEDRHGHLCFASEIKALLERVPEIHTLPPGSFRLPAGEVVSFYQVPEPTGDLCDADEAAEAVEEVLLQAVRRRLNAGVPVGALLSGGLDSSLVAAMVRQEVAGEVHTFAVGLKDSPDLQNARRMAEFLGTIHHERVLTPDEITASLPVVISQLESFDPALVRGSVGNYFVSGLASQHVKIVLTGEGADELFAGYHYLAEWADEPEALAAELRSITAQLHNTSLQRCDRMALVHGLEVRLPFLDLQLIDLAARIDPGLKWRRGEGKWILRRVAAKYLPPEIAWRGKEKFAIGTGVAQVLERHAAALYPRTGAGFAEEQLYWSLFRKRYGRQDIIAQMGHSRSLNPTQRWAASV